MVGQAAGWFRDPAPRNPDAPDTWRYWDGRAWTAQTRTGTKQQRREWREQVAAERRLHLYALYERAQYGDEDAHGQLIAMTGPAPRSGPTVDGQRLAGWWLRVGATVVDGCLVTLAGCLLGWPFLAQVVTATSRWLEAASRAQRTGSPVPDPQVLVDELGTSFLLASLVLVAVGVVYEAGFLRFLQATPGKLLLGLRVRPDGPDGPLAWRAVLLRATGKSGAAFLQVLPFGTVGYAVYWFLDRLWPLGDRRRQSLHDKLARTLVVRRD